jgi:hypothetical protein
MKYQKAASYILTSSLLLVLASCEKEKPLEEAIIGKWEVSSITQITYTNDVKKSEFTVFLESGEMGYQFVEGGSGIYNEDEVDHLFSWTLAGSKLTITNLYTEDLVVDARLDGGTLTMANKVPDDQNPANTIEILFTAKKVN